MSKISAYTIMYRNGINSHAIPSELQIRRNAFVSAGDEYHAEMLARVYLYAYEYDRLNRSRKIISSFDETATATHLVWAIRHAIIHVVDNNVNSLAAGLIIEQNSVNSYFAISLYELVVLESDTSRQNLVDLEIEYRNHRKNCPNLKVLTYLFDEWNPSQLTVYEYEYYELFRRSLFCENSHGFADHQPKATYLNTTMNYLRDRYRPVENTSILDSLIALTANLHYGGNVNLAAQVVRRNVAAPTDSSIDESSSIISTVRTVVKTICDVLMYPIRKDYHPVDVESPVENNDPTVMNHLISKLSELC